MLKVKDPLSFEICTFRNGQHDSDDNPIILVAMDSILEQRSFVCAAFASADEPCPESHGTWHRL